MAVDWLVDASVEAAEAGEIDVALRLLQAAAMRAWWGDLGLEVRGRIARAARGIESPEVLPTVLSILAMSNAEGTTDRLLRIGSESAPAGCDAETAFALGAALHVVGAFDRSAVFL